MDLRELMDGISCLSIRSALINSSAESIQTQTICLSLLKKVRRIPGPRAPAGESG